MVNVLITRFRQEEPVTIKLERSLMSPFIDDRANCGYLNRENRQNDPLEPNPERVGLGSKPEIRP